MTKHTDKYKTNPKKLRKNKLININIRMSYTLCNPMTALHKVDIDENHRNDDIGKEIYNLKLKTK